MVKNQIRSVPLYAEKFKIQYYAKGNYYPYNAEGVYDFSWGCAYRTLQMVLSNKNATHDTQTMDYYYYHYGYREKMYELFKKMKKIDKVPEYITNMTVLAPAERANGYGDSLLGQLIAFDHGIDIDMFWLNGRLNTTVPDVLYRGVMKFPEWK